MTATAVLKAAADAGISVTLDGDQLVLRSRREPDRSIVELIRSYKPAIVPLLRDAGGRRPTGSRCTTKGPASSSTMVACRASRRRRRPPRKSQRGEAT
jgi:hypothetical protein